MRQNYILKNILMQNILSSNETEIFDIKTCFKLYIFRLDINTNYI